MTLRPRSAFVPVALAALLAACGSEPKVDIQTAQSPAASEAPAAAPAAGEPAAAHNPATAAAPAGQDLPAGHPPVGDLPPGHPPVQPGQTAPGMGGAPFRPAVAPGGQGGAALAWTAPKGWTPEPPANEMRRAQYRVPGAGGAGGDGECVVFYFGPGQGGDPMSNAERWASQFTPPGGGSPTAALKTRSEKVGAIQVLFVETHGTYQSGGMGAPVVAKPGYALLGAIAEGPDANWFFKLTAPEATAQAQRGAFEAMIRSLKPGA